MKPFNPKDIQSEIDAIVQAQTGTLRKAMQSFLTSLAEDSLEVIKFELHPDGFHIYASAVPSETEIVDLCELVNDEFFAAVADRLNEIPEPNTKEGFASIEKVFEYAEEKMLKAIGAVWKELNGSSKASKAYAWATDANEVLNLSTGKFENSDTSEFFEPSPGIGLQPAKRIEYDSLSDEELASLPSFFTEDVEWTAEREQQEIAAMKKFCDEAISKARGPLVENLRKSFAHDETLLKALCIDFQFSKVNPPSLEILGVSKNQKESELLPQGAQVDLGRQTSLLKWSTVYEQVMDVLCTSQYGNELFAEIDADQTVKMTLMIASAWQEVCPKSPPVFFRGSYSNQWHQPGHPEKALTLKEAKTLAKAKPQG